MGGGGLALSLWGDPVSLGCLVRLAGSRWVEPVTLPQIQRPLEHSWLWVEVGEGTLLPQQGVWSLWGLGGRGP